MRWVVLFLLLLAPAPAAARTWQAPVPGTDYSAGVYGQHPGSVSVSGDGTTIAASAGPYVEVRSGASTYAAVSPVTEDVFTAAGGEHDLAAAWSADVDGDFHVFAITATATGLGAPVDLGAGTVTALESGSAGDMTLMFTGAHGGTFPAFRPAGGAFGPVERVPDTQSFAVSEALAVTPTGDTLIVGDGDAATVTTRAADGTYLPPVTLGRDIPGYYDPVVGVDARGRAIVLWATDVEHGMYRDASGRWHDIGGLPVITRTNVRPSVGVDAAGDVVVAYQAPSGNTAYATGSLDDGTFDPPVETPMAGPPRLVTAPDGSTLIVAGTGDRFQVLDDFDAGIGVVRALRRDGTGAFGPVLVVGCGANPVPGGFDAAGTATLGLAAEGGRLWTLARDAPGAPVDRTCAGSRPITRSPAPASALTAGVPGRLAIAIPAGGTLRRVDWDVDGRPGYDLHTRTPAVRYAFGGGRTLVLVRAALAGSSGTIAGGFVVNAVPKVSLVARPQSLQSILASGLTVSVRAGNAASVGTDVWISVPSRHNSMAKLLTTLGAESSSIQVPVTDFGRQRLTRLGGGYGSFAVTLRVSLLRPGSKTAVDLPIAAERRARITP